jgi:hypothetical protein
MNFATSIGLSLRSDYARPAQQPDLAYYETNRQVIHLSKAKHCSDQADHLSAWQTGAIPT